jgi:hypothetical protein
MNSKCVIISLLLASCLFLAIRCSGPTKITGNSSQTPNAVVGILYQSDGTTPAAGVRVHIRPRKSLADTSGAGLPKKLAAMAATDSVVTDSAGRFAFDTTIDTGTYVITSANGNNAVLIDSVAVKNKAATDLLAPDTLKPAGALKGVIRLSEGGDPRKVFVLAFGIDRFARVNVDGSFKFSGLAEAKYDLRLISSLDNYGVLDTVGVAVRSADTLNMGTINLPFTGIPTPKNVSINYDTLKQIVALSWSKPDSSLVKGLNVYRRNVDSNSVLKQVNTSPITDTLYRDSTGIQDQTYEYRVAAVDKNSTEGTKSAGVSVKVVGAFVWIDTIGVGHLTYPGELKIDSKGRIIVPNIDSTSGKHNVVIFDSTINYITSFGEGLLNYPASVVLDSLDNIYIGAQNGVFKFDPNGNILDTFFLTTSGFPIDYLAISDTFLYVSHGGTGYVRKYSLNGDSIAVWGGVGNLNGQFVGGSNYGLVVFNSEVYVCDQQSRRIQIFDLDGKFLNSWQEPFSSYTNAQPVRISLDSSGNFYIVLQSPNSILIYSENRVQLGKIEFESPVPDIKGILSKGSKIFIAMGNSIRVYTKPKF